MRGSTALALILLMIGPRFALGATWQVTKDPAIAADQIGQVVVQAASGDTILIGPGTYNEHIPLGEKALTLIGTSGAEATVLDGSVPIEGREGSILYEPSAAHVDLTLVGLTFTGGTGGPLPLRGVAGGAIRLRSTEWSGLLRVRDCTFRDNMLPPVIHYGGALYLTGMADAEFTNCEFARNRADWGSGGHAYLVAGYYRFDSCHFLLDDSGSWSAMCIDAYYNTGRRLELENCVLESVPGTVDADASILASGEVVLRNNHFIDVDSHTARRLNLREDIHAPLTVRMEGNVFAGPSATSNEYDVKIQSLDCGSTTIENNTLVGAPIKVHCLNGPPLLCSNNTFCRGRSFFLYDPGGRVACNNAWPDSMTFYLFTTFETEGNIAADPLFCDEPAGDYTIAQESPCAPDQSPGGCGLIGALPVACSRTPTAHTTWGRVRALFR